MTYVYITGQILFQVKFFEPRLIFNFLCLLVLIIHESGLKETKEIENQPRLN